jgi:B12-binding domain/radical SAM domain protein
LGAQSLVFRAHKSSRYSIAALVGSIETDPRLVSLNVHAPLGLPRAIIKKELEHGQVVVAHSVMSTQVTRVEREVKATRARFGEKVTLVAGGPHASARPSELLDMGFDYVVVGEGEASFRELLWALTNDRDPVTIQGVVSKDSASIPTPRSFKPIDLDDYPPFAVQANIVGPVEVTRGCPFRCKFCATPFLTGGTVRHRSVESITYWLRKAVEELGFRRTWFLSPNALSYGGRGRKVEADKLESLLKVTTSLEGLDLFFGSFPSEVRPEFVTSDLLHMLRKHVANKTIQIGLQSGSDRVLDLCRRQHSVQQGLDAIAMAQDAGFIPHVDMIFGLPSETDQDIDASIEICETLASQKAKIHGHVFMPLPGSEWADMPAGRLSKRTRQILGELSRKKIVTGSWCHQEDLGKKLEPAK